MVQINLLPWREQERKRLKIQFLTMLGFGLICVISIVIMTHFVFSYMLTSQLHRNAFLSEQINQVITETSTLETEKKNGMKTLDNLRFIIRLQAKNFQTIQVLNEITKHVPTAIVLDKIDKSDNALLLEGSAVSNTDVTQFIKELSATPVIVNSELTKIVTSGKEGETRKNFQIKAEQKDLDAK